MSKKIIQKYELEGYSAILQDIKSLLEKAKLSAFKAVDNIRVQTYWQIGERIAREELKYQDRADYGKRIVSELSKDLGFAERLLYRILQFYKFYPILSQVATELSWSHYIELLSVATKEERQIYELLSIKNNWNRNELRQQIKKRAARKYKNGKAVKLSPNATQLMPQDVFKNSYSFDFLVGRREVPLLIGGNYDKIDMELFHAGLMCYILVEVKIEPFKHSHVSQMYSYLNWYKENKWKKGQRLPIGLIICKSKDEETVHYALGDLRKEIFVSEYKVKLPSEKEITKRLK